MPKPKQSKEKQGWGQWLREQRLLRGHTNIRDLARIIAQKTGQEMTHKEIQWGRWEREEAIPLPSSMDMIAEVLQVPREEVYRRIQYPFAGTQPTGAVYRLKDGTILVADNNGAFQRADEMLASQLLQALQNVSERLAKIEERLGE